MCLVERRTAPDPFSSSDKENVMKQQLFYWGPAHLRDEETSPETEPSERPDDN